MSRSRSKRRTTLGRESLQPDQEIIDGLSFHPLAICGGSSLSAAEYTSRSRACTENQLQILQESEEFKAWGRDSGKMRNVGGPTRWERTPIALPKLGKLVGALVLVAMVGFLATGPVKTRLDTRTISTVIANAPSTLVAVRPQAAVAIIDTAAETLASKEMVRSDLLEERARANALEANLKAARQEALMEHRRLQSQLQEAVRRETLMAQTIRRMSQESEEQQQKMAQSRDEVAADQSTEVTEALGLAFLSAEGALLAVAAVLILGLRRSRYAAVKAQRQYLAAYRRQQAVLARAEDVYHEATEVRAQAQRTATRDMDAAAAADNTKWASAASQIAKLVDDAALNDSHVSADKEEPTSPPSPGTITRLVAERLKSLGRRAAMAEAAASEAILEAQGAQEERVRGNQQLSEALTETTALLKETKDALEAAEYREVEAIAALDEVRASLEAVEAERMALQAEKESLCASLSKEGDRAVAASRVEERLEAQIEQLTVSLGDEAAQKQRAEARVAQLEADLSALRILAEGLRAQVSDLEAQLESSRAAQAELSAATADWAAAETALADAGGLWGLSNNAGAAPTPEAQRALGERAAALERLGAAELRAAEGLNDGELPLRPPSSRFTAKTPPAHVMNSFVTRLGEIASMVAGDKSALMSRSDSAVTTARGPPSVSSAGRRKQIGGKENVGRRPDFTSFMAHAQKQLAKASLYLGQELPVPLEGAAHKVMMIGGSRPGSSASSAPDIDAYTAGLIRSGNNKASDEKESYARLTANQQALEDVQRLMRTLETSENAEAGDVLQRLSLAHDQIGPALEEATAAFRNAARNRADYERQVDAVQQCQALLVEAEKALTAAVGEGDANGKQESSEEEVALAARNLTAAEDAHRGAVDATYEAERALHAAVKEQLAAEDILRRRQDAMELAVKEAARVLEGSLAPATLDAWTVSPRAPLGPAPDVFDGEEHGGRESAEAVTELYNRKFFGAPKDGQAVQAAAVHP